MSTDRLNEVLGSPIRSKLPSAPQDRAELPLTSRRKTPIRRRLAAPLLSVAACVVVVVVRLAYIGGRDTDTGLSQTPIDTISVDSTHARGRRG